MENYLVNLEKGLREFDYLVNEGVCFSSEELELLITYNRRLGECIDTIRIFKQIRGESCNPKKPKNARKVKRKAHTRRLK
jgi:hypothetical protein